MSVEAVNMAGGLLKSPLKATEQIDTQRRSQDIVSESKQKDVQPEELLSQIKELTENGLYSVRFENNRDSQELVVKIVDRNTDEVIRQIPAEELLGLAQKLEDLRGNLLHTMG